MTAYTPAQLRALEWLPEDGSREKLVDQKCMALAKHFLLSTIVEDHLTVSLARIERDTASLAAAIQEAVEDWFAANPVEDEGGVPK